MVKKILKLNKQPVIEAVLEIRFEKSENIINILPGLLQNEILSIKNLPANNISLDVRTADPNLQYVPLIVLDLKDYSIFLGDRLLGFSKKNPYQGWFELKEFALSILDKLSQYKLSETFVINRYSLKYVNIVDNLSDIKFNFSLGTIFNVNNISFKTEFLKDDFHYNIQIASNAEVSDQNGFFKKGIYLDIDANKVEVIDFKTYKKLNEKLDFLHDSIKNLFSDLISDIAIERMEPIYLN